MPPLHGALLESYSSGLPVISLTPSSPTASSSSLAMNWSGHTWADEPSGGLDPPQHLHRVAPHKSTSSTVTSFAEGPACIKNGAKCNNDKDILFEVKQDLKNERLQV